MALKDDLISDVSNILTKDWSIRNGQVVPYTEEVALTGGAVKLEVTMIYADLADSTELSMHYDKRIAAKVIKSFLTCSSRIIRARGGEIRSFDGDRVMERIQQQQNVRSRSIMLSKKLLNPNSKESIPT